MHNIQQLQASQQYQQVVARLATMSDAEALETLTTFVHEFPAYAQAQNDLGVVQQRVGNHLQALGRYERAVRLEPSNPVFIKNLASFYYVVMAWGDEAIAMYTDLLRVQPNDIDLLGALAIISKDQGLDEQAQIFLQRIVDLEPWNQEARAGLQALTASVVQPAALAEQHVNPVDKLLAELGQVPGVASNSQQQVAGDPTIADLEKRLADDPTSALLNNDLGVLYTQAGNLEKALAHHELAYRFAPGNLVFLKNYAGVCSCNGQYIDKAIELLTTALQKHPDDCELLAALANVSLQTGRPNEALIFLQRILDFEPWNNEARNLVHQLQSRPADFFLSR